jgi:hypothetical protein
MDTPVLGRLLPVEVDVSPADPRFGDRHRIARELARRGGFRLGRLPGWRRVVWFTSAAARDAALEAVRAEYGWTVAGPDGLARL